MNLDSLAMQVAVALAGGIAAELLHWYALSRKDGGADAFKAKPIYWVTTLGMVLLGGLMPVLYIQGSASALLCFHLGAATPVIVQKLVANLPAGVAQQNARDNRATLRSFFAW